MGLGGAYKWGDFKSSYEEGASHEVKGPLFMGGELAPRDNM